MRYRSTEPHWVTARWNGKCTCGKPIRRGEEAFYYPIGKKLCGKTCGCAEAASRDFGACAFDDAQVS